MSSGLISKMRIPARLRLSSTSPAAPRKIGISAPSWASRAKPAALLALVMAISPPMLATAQPLSPQSAPVIYSIEPASAPAGEQITIVGRGFSMSNTVRLGGKSISDVSIAWSAGISCVQGNPACHPGINQALSIMVPRDATAGQYDVSVENENGVSNIATFTLIGPSPAPAR
jgi:hypothetical protein